MTVSEKVAYVKGLADGMNLEAEKSKEAKLLTAIIDVLEDIGYSLEDLDNSVSDLGEGLDAVSDDLELIEDIIYDEDEDEDEFTEMDESDYDDYDFDDETYELECPNCGDKIVIDEQVLASGVINCPGCNQRLELCTEEEAEDFDDDEDEE